MISLLWTGIEKSRAIRFGIYAKIVIAPFLAHAGEGGRTAEDYLNLCFNASTPADFRQSLLAEGGWQKIELHEENGRFSWDEDIGELTPEKLALISNFSIRKVLGHSSLRSVQSSLKYSVDNYSFESNLFPLTQDDRQHIYYHAKKQRLLAVRGYSETSLNNCYYSAFGLQRGESLIEQYAESGEQKGSIEDGAVRLRIYPELNDDGFTGAVYFADQTVMEHFFGFQFGHLVHFQFRN